MLRRFVAITLSPFAVIPAVLLLFTSRPRAAATAFAVAWLVGVACGTAAGVLLADILALGADRGAVAGWLRIAFGAGLTGAALKEWFSRHASSEPPAWMRSIRSSEPADAGKLGVTLSGANPKVLLLALAGAGAVASEVYGFGAQALAVLVFAGIASVTVAAPLITYIALGERALPTLDRAGTWLDRNSGALVAVVLLVIRLGLLASGVKTVAG